jgi:hypothetical protein
MGNCLNICGDRGRDGAADDNDKETPADGRKEDEKLQGKEKIPPVSNKTPPVVRSTTLTVHGGLLEEQTTNVYDKYQEIEILGNGSMGHVARVRAKEGYISESHFKPDNNKRNKDFLSRKTNSSISERPTIDYALKSIQLDRVSHVFIEELKNEIEVSIPVAKCIDAKEEVACN